jgi:hypothetical protein
MKKVLLSLTVAFSFLYTSNAQVTKTDDVKKELQTQNVDTVAWVYGGVLNIGANGGLLHNWAAGGELASLLVNSIFSGHLDYLHHTDVWSNNLDLAYGLTYNYSTGFLPHKTDDRIDFTSKYGKRIDNWKEFYFTGLFNFKSQFTKGFDYTLPNWDSVSTSKFLSPAYFTAAIGMEYRKGSDVSLFLSPVAARLTVVDQFYTTMSPQGAYGVPYGKNHQYQLGAYFSGRYVININKNMVYKTRLDLYSNYLAKDTKNDTTGAIIKKDNPGNIDVLFDNLFSWKISKYINITLGATFIYDNDIPYSKTYVQNGVVKDKNEPGENLGWVQMKDVFTFGVSYKF